MKTVKWIAIGFAAVVVLVIGALLAIPMFVDVQKYKPEIEKQVSQATGCPFSIGGDLKLSLFPWAGLAFADLRLGNPPGFQEKQMVAVKSFDVKVKFLPLLSKQIQVNRFVVDGLAVVLEKGKDGKGNWEAVGKAQAKPAAAAKPEAKKEPPGAPPLGDLPIKGLEVKELAVRNASLTWIDAAKGQKKQIKDLGLELKDVSFDGPILLRLAADVDGQPLQVEGKLGPLGRALGKNPIPLDLTVKAVKEIDIKLKGTLVDVLARPGFDLALDLAPFSPRKLLAALNQPLPLTPADPNTFTRLSLKTKVKGNAAEVTLSEGTLELDQSKIGFTASAKDFAKPDLSFKITLDQIDVDRYLPAAVEKKPADPGAAVPAAQEKKKTDYGPLRKLVLDGEVKAGKLKAKGAQVQDVVMKIKGRDGLFTVDPFGLKAYEGTIKSRVDLDVRADRPKTAVDLETAGVKARPLLNDVMKKDFLEGTTQAKLSLKMEGDEPEQIKKTLNGGGDLRFTDGAIIGIDLAGMVRNAKAAFGLGEKTAEKPKTDFAELTAPFTIKDGLVNTPGTAMASPLLRVVTTGNANLVTEALDMRVEPKVVATLKGQGDTKDRSGLMVPVLVTGTFASPKFAPDLKGMLQQTLKEGVPSTEGVKDMIKGGGTPGTAPTEKGKELLKGLPFGK